MIRFIFFNFFFNQSDIHPGSNIGFSYISVETINESVVNFMLGLVIFVLIYVRCPTAYRPSYIFHSIIYLLFADISVVTFDFLATRFFTSLLRKL